MTTQDRVSRLESLLERIRRNARALRAAQPAPVAAKAMPVSPVEPKPITQPVAAPAPPPIVAAAPLEIEATTLPPVAASAAPEPPAAPTPPPAWAAEHGSSVQARPGTLPPPEELSEDDLLDVTTLPPAPVAAAGDASAGVGIDAPFEDEQAPASSRRSKVAATLDEALAGATELEQEEEEREVPVKTPPPESGPQEALPPGLEAPGVPDVERLEADLLGPPSMGPTAEQLGETIELDEPVGPELEIDVAVSGGPVTEPERPPEELEVALPRAPMPSGTYDVAPPHPPLDIEITEVSAEASLVPAEPLSREFVPTVPVQRAPAEELGPERTQRAAHGATDVARVVLAPSSAPKNFVELLDVSLGL